LFAAGRQKSVPVAANGGLGNASYDLEVAQDELQRTIERDARPLVA
jgi:hypothetical protein